MSAAEDIGALGTAARIGGAAAKTLDELRAIWYLAYTGDESWVDRLGYLGGDLTKDQAAAVRRIIETYGPADRAAAPAPEPAPAEVAEPAPVEAAGRVVKWNKKTRRHSWLRLRSHWYECRHCGLQLETRQHKEVNPNTGEVGRGSGRFFHVWYLDGEIGTDVKPLKTPDCRGTKEPEVSEVPAIRVGV